jgi:glycosyltransferase 2 family protein
VTVPSRPSLWRDAKRWLPGVVISLVALFVVFRFVNWQELSAAWGTAAQPLNILAAVLLSILSVCVRAFLWKTLLKGRTSFINSFFIINIGYLLNNLFPLRAGEIGRAVFMGRSSGLGPFHVLSTIVLERAFDLMAAAILLLSTLPLAFGQDWMRPVATVTLLIVFSALVVLYLMARYSRWVHDLILRLGSRWPLVQRYLVPQVDALLDGLSALTSLRSFATALVWVALSWTLWQIIYYVMLVAIAPGAPFWWAIFMDAVLALGMAIPSAPAGLGVYEASVVAALSVLGISASTALAFAIVMHFLQFAITAVFGFWGLAREGKSLSSLWSEVNLNRTGSKE